MYLLDLLEACRGSGLRIAEVDGWRTRGHGPMSGVRTIVCHHTAGPATGEAPSLNYIRDRGLSQLVLGRSGTVYVVAAGLCWHAGVVHQPSTGNTWAIGIEAEATGTAAWPAVQYDAYARLCASLVDHYGLTVARVLGHKEVAAPAGRKTDPNFDMAAFRAVVTDHLEDDMFTPEDRVKLNALAARTDVGFARDQIMTHLGKDPGAAPVAPPGREGIEVARRVDVGFALEQIMARLDAIEARLPTSTTDHRASPQS
jgi:hypothetical protein